MTRSSTTDVLSMNKLEEEYSPNKMKYEDPHPLIAVLAKRGIPVNDFAEKLGYSKSYFQMVLMRWKRPGAKLALEIEKNTGVSVSYLLRIPLKSEYK